MVKVKIHHETFVLFPTADKWSVVEPRDVLNIYSGDTLISTIRTWQYVEKVTPPAEREG